MIKAINRERVVFCRGDSLGGPLGGWIDGDLRFLVAVGGPEDVLGGRVGVVEAADGGFAPRKTALSRLLLSKKNGHCLPLCTPRWTW